jgi:hypothetical protein
MVGAISRSSHKTLPASTSSTSVAKYKDVKSKICYKPEDSNDEEINYQLDALGAYGHFVSIDATHNTNKYAWKLTTLFVQNKVCFSKILFYLMTFHFIEWSTCCCWISFDPKRE